MPAVKCQSCNNQTLDPSGYCHLHQNGTHSSDQPPLSIGKVPVSASAHSGKGEEVSPLHQALLSDPRLTEGIPPFVAKHAGEEGTFIQADSSSMGHDGFLGVFVIGENNDAFMSAYTGIDCENGRESGFWPDDYYSPFMTMDGGRMGPKQVDEFTRGIYKEFHNKPNGIYAAPDLSRPNYSSLDSVSVLDGKVSLYMIGRIGSDWWCATAVDKWDGGSGEFDDLYDMANALLAKNGKEEVFNQEW